MNEWMGKNMLVAIVKVHNTFDNVNKKSVILERVLYAAEMLVAASKNNYENLQLSPKNVQITLNKTCK